MLVPMAWLRSLAEAGGMTPVRQTSRRRRRRSRAAELVRNNGNGLCWTLTDRPESIDAMSSTRPPAGASLERRTASVAEAAESTPRSGTPGSGAKSLLWLVFPANGSVLVVALLLLTFSPIEIDATIKAGQFALLLAGFVVLVALNLLLLRRVLAPLVRPTDLMKTVDPDRPGRRLAGIHPRSAEGQALMASFNSMLDRLESARREAARTALAAQ
jgi:HAMP domain-containing protein